MPDTDTAPETGAASGTIEVVGCGFMAMGIETVERKTSPEGWSGDYGFSAASRCGLAGGTCQPRVVHDACFPLWK